MILQWIYNDFLIFFRWCPDEFPMVFHLDSRGPSSRIIIISSISIVIAIATIYYYYIIRIIISTIDISIIRIIYP